jgi:Fungal potassium channel
VYRTKKLRGYQAGAKVGLHRKDSQTFQLLVLVVLTCRDKSLNDFKSTSCFEPLAYGYLLGSLVVSVAVYALDTFTAIQLLAFNHWSSQISPAISFDISKWIFAICIMLSFINLGYEYIRAFRVMKRDAVAESYLDTLAVRVQCIRMGHNGHGWRRFLVFAELTRSKKGAEYIALFTYFSFQGKRPGRYPP